MKLTEAELELRDDEAEKVLREAIAARRAEARELREQAVVLEKRATAIEAAVKAERWYELGDVLNQAAIESLCEVSPTDLLGE